MIHTRYAFAAIAKRKSNPSYHNKPSEYGMTLFRRILIAPLVNKRMFPSMAALPFYRPNLTTEIPFFHKAVK